MSGPAKEERTMRVSPLVSALIDHDFVCAGTAGREAAFDARPYDTFGPSARCHPAGILFAADLQPPVDTSHGPVNRVADAARVARARHWPAVRVLTQCGDDYRTVARAIPRLQAFDAALEGVGPVFVRFGQGHTPDVAAAKLDILFALGQTGARLYELLMTPSVRKTFVEANGEEAAESVQDQARYVFAQAHDALQLFATGLASWAMAQIQHPYLSRQTSGSTAAFSPQLLARHEEAMAWPHGVSVAGGLFKGPLVEPNHLGWFRWNKATMAQMDSLMGPRLRAVLFADGPVGGPQSAAGVDNEQARTAPINAAGSNNTGEESSS